MVLARTGDGSVVYMPDGQAEQYRDATRVGDLICIVPDCLQPRLKAVNRGDRRHGFAHMAGGGHASMGVHHLQAQLLVAAWLHSRYPDAKVELEETTEDGRRRADVMLTSRTGRQAAFEIQYAGLSPAEWQARHASYVEQGILDVWIWGHTHPHLRPERADTDSVAISPVLQAAAAAAPLAWINPELGELAIATRKGLLPHTGASYSQLATAGPATIEIVQLEAWRLDGRHGFTCERIEELREVERQALAAEEYARRRAEEEEAAEARRFANMTAYFERIAAKAAALEAAWATDPLRQRLLDHHGGRRPPFLGVEVHRWVNDQRQSIILPVPPIVWQSHLYADLILGKPVGTHVVLRRLTEQLLKHDPDVRPDVAADAVRSWARVLCQHRVLERQTVEWASGPGIRYIVAEPVQRTISSPRIRPTDGENLAHDRANAEIDGFLATEPDLLTLEQLLTTGVKIGRVAERCVQCRGRAADWEAQRLGYHPRCAAALSKTVGHPLTAMPTRP